MRSNSAGEADENVKVSKALWNLIGRMSKAGMVLFDFHGDNVMFHPNNLDSSGRSTGYEARLIDFTPPLRHGAHVFGFCGNGRMHEE